MTISLSRGRSRSIFYRLCVRAPRNEIWVIELFMTALLVLVLELLPTIVKRT